MDFIIRIVLWVAGIYFLTAIARAAGMGFGFETQVIILLWIATIYSDARYHQFKLI
jgi:hypothetical protein